MIHEMCNRRWRNREPYLDPNELFVRLSVRYKRKGTASYWVVGRGGEGAIENWCHKLVIYLVSSKFDSELFVDFSPVAYHAMCYFIFDYYAVGGVIREWSSSEAQAERMRP